MPPKRRARARAPVSRARISTRKKDVAENDIPDVYQDMLAEAASSSSAYEHRLVAKRRKISEEPTNTQGLDTMHFVESRSPVEQLEEQQKPLQVVFDDFQASDESDVEFEDVELGTNLEASEAEEPSQEPMQLDLSKPIAATPSRHVLRRRPVSPAERKLRLDVHKAHLLLLLVALQNRNRWCESEAVQAILKPLVPRKTISLLHLDESRPQYQRAHSFNKGIEEVCALWRAEWEIIARGICRAHWRDDVDAVKESEDAEDFIDFDDFIDAARTHTGSRDLGVQLFCALLRSVAVETRLVCSLQVLPFSGVAKGLTPHKSRPEYIHASAQSYDKSPQSSVTVRAQSSPKRIAESQYPIYWVEVLSPATSTWIPLDPLVRHTINKPKTGFEPPASDQLNSMSYVIAFEDDGSARDVTRRYAQWYNAKMRKTRVESTKGGEQWWRKTMHFFTKGVHEVRDELEDVEFMRRAEAEGMPRNVQDFKRHPVYVLERHLRANEVIQPRREVGKVAAGVSKTAKLETVFRRQDVHLCRTADAWYRRGRDVKVGETPLKRAVPKRPRDERTGSFDEDDQDDAEGVALYAEYQTEVFEPPPVVNDRIPRNAFDNLDVYVPSMIPAGAVHIRHPLAARAAKVLEIDFVEAVTGFEFKGRQGTAIIDGVVVTANMRMAMVAVIVGLQSQAAEESERERSRVVLSMWKRWLTALRVREKVAQEYGGNEENDDAGGAAVGVSEDEDGDDESETFDNNDEEDDDFGGGFMPEAVEAKPETKESTRKDLPFPKLKPLPDLLPSTVVHHEILVVESPHKLPSDRPTKSIDDRMTDNDQPGGFLMDDNENEDDSLRNHQMDIDEEGGGFMVDDENSNEEIPAASMHVETLDEDENEGEGGGFLQDDEVPATAPTITHSQAVDDPPSPVVTGTPRHDPFETQDQKYDQDDAASNSGDLSDTSMLSHDPAEDDAEPEWLLDSLGD